VFVAKSGLIQHRVVEVSFALDRDELTRMSNYLSSILGGKTLAEVRREIVSAMRDERTAADTIMRHALFLGERTLSAPSGDGLVVEGERTFLDHPEFADIERMRKLLRAFEEKTVLLRLLDAATTTPIESQVAVSELTTVVLGSETSVKDIRDLAAVSATYSSDQGPAGRVGVIGPTRMNYARVIPLVEMTAEALSQSLSAENPLAEPDDESE
jgi:heat-inducible transcriptional repressor